MRPIRARSRRHVLSRLPVRLLGGALLLGAALGVVATGCSPSDVPPGTAATAAAPPASTGALPPGAAGATASGAPATALPGASLTVHAAASLSDVLPRIAAGWTAAGGAPVTFNFEASSRLAKQIEAGAPADLFFSADADWMRYLDERGLIDRTTRTDLLGNRLVVVVPATSALVLEKAGDLATAPVARLALAGPSVPAGKYARAALASGGVWAALEKRVVDGDNVRTALAWVARAEADAGIVYATDARVEPRVRVALAFDPATHPPIVYPAAVLASSASAGEARRFLAYCRGPAARAAFEAAGFLSIAPPLP